MVIQASAANSKFITIISDIYYGEQKTMAGFFGLFGSKTKYVDESTQDNEPSQNGEGFFLGKDDASSMGNPEYIRKSMAKKKAPGNDSKSSPTTTSSESSRRPVDTNMDIFRKMARDIKKK